MGFVVSDNARPVRAKALILCAILLVLLPFQGERNSLKVNPGRCPGLGAVALSGRALPTTSIYKTYLLQMARRQQADVPRQRLRLQGPPQAAVPQLGSWGLLYNKLVTA